MTNTLALSPNFSQYVVDSPELHGGVQFLLRFPNGYGASIISHEFSYGVELAVMKWTGEEANLDYSTPITDDVLGHLDAESLETALSQIYAL